MTAKQIYSKIRSWLQRDGLILLLYILATLLMTYPLVLNLGTNWTPTQDSDVFMQLWDINWLSNFSSNQSLFYTYDLFYPNGLDLSFHSISWTTAGFSTIIAPFIGIISAYNITILWAIFSTAYAAYLFILSLLPSRSAAWLGGLVYSFIPTHILHSNPHPTLAHLAFIPLITLLMSRALRKNEVWTAVTGALLVALAALTSLYILIFVALTLIPVFLYLAIEQERWRSLQFWKITTLFAFLSTLFLAPRLYPILQNPSTLSEAIEQKYKANITQTDPLSFITPSHFHPFSNDYIKDTAARFYMNQKWPAYLGAIPLILMFIALFKHQNHRMVYLWFSIFIFFVLLSIGPVLRFNGQIYENIILPAHYASKFPPIRTVRPDYFVLAAAFPLAICSAFGLDVLLIKMKHRWLRIAFVTIISVLLLFEYWNGSYRGQFDIINPFYKTLAAKSEDFALIDIPMGRQNSKIYIYQQTVHQRPIVEGLSGRTPEEAYEYIEQNKLLSSWRTNQALDCNLLSNTEIKEALDQLALDGFQYVIFHRGYRDADAYEGYLQTAVSVYEDDELAVYRLEDLQQLQFCP